MFREMRRKRQQLDEAACRAVLERGTSGVLAVSGDDGYPYAVPLSYVYTEGKLFFHPLFFVLPGGVKLPGFGDEALVRKILLVEDAVI